MGLLVAIWLILICIPSTIILSETNSQDVTALLTLKQMWKNVPPSWNRGNDSCGGQWEGIACRDSRIISITLSSMGLIGILPGDIQGLSELETLDLSYNKGLSGHLPPEIGNLAKLTTLILAGCNFNGELPDTIGSLSKLVFLSLNSNGFSGTIPQTIGKLSELYWLDLAANKLTGNIPISPGLDMLVQAKLFHFGRNQLSGAIPPQLFNENMNLLHLLLDNNQFSGTIPTTLSLVRTLEVIRFDWNSLIGSVPLSINTLIVLKTLLLSNNKLAGVMPDLTGMNLLSYLDMSNNSFEVSDVPSWITALPSLTTLMMEQSQIQGIIPSAFFGLPQLQTVVLKSNKLSGMLDLGAAHSSQLQFVDLQNNSISDYTRRPADNNLQLILVGNPVCGTVLTEQSQLCFLPQSSQSYTTPQNCETVPCTSGSASSPSCHCSYPYSGTLTFVAPQFSNLQNFTNYGALERAFMNTFFASKMPVDSVSLSNVYRDTSNYLHITLQIFPLGQDRFNRTTILTIGFMLSSQTFKPPSYYGAFTFLPAEYTTFSDGSEPGSASKSKSLAIVGGSIAGVISMILAVLAAKHYKIFNNNNISCQNCCNFSFGSCFKSSEPERALHPTERQQRNRRWCC